MKNKVLILTDLTSIFLIGARFRGKMEYARMMAAEPSETKISKARPKVELQPEGQGSRLRSRQCADRAVTQSEAARMLDFQIIELLKLK